jgi:transposase
LPSRPRRAYLLQTGCQWRMLPRDFPPSSTVYAYFRTWIVVGVWAHVHDVLNHRTRELEGRDENPTAAIIDSESVKPVRRPAKWSDTTPESGSMPQAAPRDRHLG